jgi:hypothetical protein
VREVPWPWGGEEECEAGREVTDRDRDVERSRDIGTRPFIISTVLVRSAPYGVLRKT